MNNDNGGDKMAVIGREPDITLLTQELTRGIDLHSSTQRIQNQENVRFCRWEGQTTDGKKHQSGETKPFPWEGASDTRVAMVDEIVNSMVDLCVTSFWRSSLRVSPVATDDFARSSNSNALMDWMINNKLYSELTREVELAAQYMWTYGWAGAHISWQQEIGYKEQELSLDQIVAMAQAAAPGTVIADLPALIMNPEAEDQVAEVLIGYFPNLKKARALKAVKELREEGECDFPVPVVTKNQPCVAVLSPYDEMVIPPETTDIQSARVVFRRTYLTQVQVEEKVLTDEWDKEWAEQAIAAMGKSSTVGEWTVTSGVLNRNNASVYENLIEVVYAYQRAVDDDGVPGIYCTVFSPHVGERAAKFDLLDYKHARYPFVVWRTEMIHRKITESRSVSEVAFTWQNEVKAQRDSIFDYTSISTIPPFEVPRNRVGGVNLGPGVRVPVTRRGEMGFMEVPQRTPSVAFELIKTIEAQADRYFGRPTEFVPPTLTQMRQQRTVNNWLHGWTEAFRQVLSLSLQYLDPEVIARVAGNAEPTSHEDMEYDISLKFDVRELNSDLVTEKIKAVSAMVLPMDSAGVIDRNKLIRLILRAIDPTMAQELVMEQGPAAQKMFDETNQEILLMASGNPPKLRENDPTAGMRLQFAQQILASNPKYQQLANTDELFRENMKKYAENLMFSVQQQENAMTGRLGVNQNA